MKVVLKMNVNVYGFKKEKDRQRERVGIIRKAYESLDELFYSII